MLGVSQPHDGDTSIDHGDVSDGAQARHSHGHDMTDTMARRDVNTIAPAQISHDTPKHNHKTTATCATCPDPPPWGAPARPFRWGRWDNSRNSARVFEKFAHKT